MPILNTETIPENRVKFRWKEQYTSEAFNDAIADTLQNGIYNGFRLIPDGNNTTSVRLDYNNNVNASSLAVLYDSDQERSFVYREQNKLTYDLDSSTYRGIRVWFYLYIDYAVGSDTTVEVRIADDQEVGASWTNQAILIGTVRVPSTGNIESKHIDHASANIGGLTSRWTQVNYNEGFEKGISGYYQSSSSSSSLVSIEQTDVYKGTSSLNLGRASSGTNTQGDVNFEVFNIEQDDKIHFRFWAKSKNFSGDTEFSVQVGNDYDEILINSDNGGFEKYGYTIDYSGNNNREEVTLKISMPNNSDTGEVIVDKFEVWVQRPIAENFDRDSGSISTSRLDLGDSSLNTPSQPTTIYSTNDSGGRTMVFEDTHGVVKLRDAGSILNAASIVDGINNSQNNALALDDLFRKGYFSGIDIQDAVSSGGSYGDLDISSGALRATYNSSGTAGSNSSLKYYQVQSQTVSFDTSKDNIVVYFNSDNVAIETDTPSNVASLNDDAVPLAYVVNDSALGAIQDIISLKDQSVDLFEQIPLTVGGRGRFDNLHAPLRIIEYVTADSTEDEWYDTDFEIEVLDDFVIDASVKETVSSPHHVFDVPDRVKIVGKGQKPEVRIKDWSEGTLFRLNGKVKFENISFIPDDLGDIPAASNGHVFFSEGSSFSEVDVKDVDFLTYDDPGGGEETLEYVFDITSFNRVSIKSCLFEGTPDSNSNRIVNLDDNGDESTIVLEDCRFIPSTPADCLGQVDFNQTNSNSVTKVKGCKFREAQPSNNSDSVVTVRSSGSIFMENCYSENYISIGGSGTAKVNSMESDFSARSDTPLYTFDVNDSLDFKMSNCFIDHTNASSFSSERSIHIASSVNANISNIRIRSEDRSVIQANGSCTIKGATIKQVNGSPSSSSYAIRIDSTIGVYNSMDIEDFPNGNAFYFASGADNNILSDIVINQPTTGSTPSDGYTNSQSNGLETDFLFV